MTKEEISRSDPSSISYKVIQDKDYYFNVYAVKGDEEKLIGKYDTNAEAWEAIAKEKKE